MIDSKGVARVPLRKRVRNELKTKEITGIGSDRIAENEWLEASVDFEERHAEREWKRVGGAGA